MRASVHVINVCLTGFANWLDWSRGLVAAKVEQKGRRHCAPCASV